MDFFIKCDQIPSFLQIWSHLLKKYLMENLIFCALTAWQRTFFFLTLLSNFYICKHYLTITTKDQVQQWIYKLTVIFEDKPSNWYFVKAANSK